MAEWGTGSRWGTGSLWGVVAGAAPDPLPAFAGAVQGPDIEFYGESDSSTWAALATDQSGRATNLTASAGWMSEANFSRLSGTGGTFTFDFVVRMERTDVGHLMAFDDIAIHVPGDGTLSIDHGAATRSFDLTSLGGTRETFLISWAMEPNPLTTGASDAMRSEVWVYNYDDALWEGDVWTHAAPTMSASATLVIGASDAAGSDAWADEVYAVRIGRAFHTSDEARACFVETPSEPTLHGVDRLEFPVPDAASGFGNDGTFAGPQYLLAARHLRTAQMLLVGPLVNEVCTGEWADNSTQTMDDPDNAGYQMHAEFLRRRPVPPTVNRVLFRVQIQQATAGGAEELGIRAYCGNAPGPVASIPSSPDEYVVHSAAVTRDADDGIGDTGGAWVEIGPVRIAKDDHGYTYPWLGFNFGSVLAARVRAWAVEPLFDDDPDVLGGGDIGGVVGG